MSQDNNKNNDDGLFNLLIYGAGAFLILKAFERAVPVVNHFWEVNRTRFLVGGSIILVAAIVGLVAYLWNLYQDATYESEVTKPDERSVPLGIDENGVWHFMKQGFRSSHTQVIGTTSCGKTESVILPWIIQDIENGSGVLIIDGKSDSQFLDKLYSYVALSGREEDFRLFSLAKVAESSAFNPLEGGSPQEVAERVFAAFPSENEYYRSVQYKIFLLLVRLIHERKQVPTFRLIHRLLTDTGLLSTWLENCQDEELKRALTQFNNELPKEKSEKVSGLDAYLTHFSSGELSILFNAEKPTVQFDEALRKNRIYYFQLPTMYYPFLAEATGKLVLQSFQSAVSKRHLGMARKPSFFSCYLDDFQDYIYAGFAALLNKSRSANIGMVFSHQALGDLDKVSAAFRNVVLTNTNIKIVMRNNDPDTCDHFAKSFGTKTTEKKTERQVSNALGETRTGEGSVREVEEFIHHPNVIKQLHIGEGIVSVPHPRGVKIVKIRFRRRPNLPLIPMPEVQKAIVPLPVLANQEAKPIEIVPK